MPIASVKRDLTDTLRHVAEGFIDAAQNRIRLVQSEVGEETDRLLGLLAFLVIAGLFAMLTLQIVALVVLTLVWDTPWRTHAMAALAALAAVATGLAYRAYVGRKERPKPIFETSIDELEKDRKALEQSL